MDWEKLRREFEIFIGELTHGSIGISIFCEHILPLRARLEGGERTEKLYNEIQAAMKEHKL